MRVPVDGEVRLDSGVIAWTLLFSVWQCCSCGTAAAIDITITLFSLLYFSSFWKIISVRCFGDGSSKKRGSGRSRSTMATGKDSVSGGPVRTEDVCARCTASLTGRQLAGEIWSKGTCYR